MIFLLLIGLILMFDYMSSSTTCSPLDFLVVVCLLCFLVCVRLCSVVR